MKAIYCVIFAVMFAAVPAFATVTVTSPSNGQTVGSNVQFTASATTSTCSKGVASIGIYINNNLKYVANGTSLNTTLSLPNGSYYAVVQEWDYCGGVSKASLSITVSTQTGVSVTSPANNTTVSNPVSFVASATTGCSKGVAAMGIYDNSQLVYKVKGSQLNTQLTLGGGSQYVVVLEWDYCGGATGTPLQLSVSSTSNTSNTSNTSGNTLKALQASGGWNQWGELPPTYSVCNAPCPGVTWSMHQHESSVSLSGNGTQFNLGGTTPYSDVLWSNPIIGQNSTQNLPDSNHTLLPTLHNFIYDADVYVTNFSVTQSLEFDVNMYMNGIGMEWGTQCDHLNTGAWDIWNNVNAKWVATGIPCSLINKGWNHVTLQVQRQSNNDLLYQSIAVNGKTYTLNITVAPFSVPSGWWGATVNYQMDGNHQQASNTTYVDNFNLTYY
ncbi:MAG TPA: Ig-like domain-containing protein [Acidobacteriaceae bacterium]|nr:Ig-like domain-containing protein [Acidobacteriaceae bacterium]